MTFNGNGHTIKLKIKDATDNYQGLFYGITETGTVTNLHVVADIHCANSRLVGGIAGENDGTIENCKVSGTVRSDWTGSGYAKVGGIAGENNGTIQYCCVTANVQNYDDNVGGLVGDNSGATLQHCTFYGNLTYDANMSNYDKYVGDKGTVSGLFDSFNQGEYDAASGKDLYRQAIKYPYTCTVKTSGTGTIRTWSADEYDVPGAQASATFSLIKTSGTVKQIDIKDADGNWVYSNGDINGTLNFTMPKRDVTATVVFWGDWPKQGTGTENDPYLISSNDDWNNFAHNVKLGRSYSGEYVKLTKDITVSQFAGDDESTPFSGHFDGDGHTIDCRMEKGSDFVAPFPVTQNATFKNLTLKGYVNVVWNHSYLAGIVGHAMGNTTFSNCRVSTTLECKNTDSRDVSGGGFVGAANNVTFEGCVFDGKLIGGNAYNCGGFGGYINSATVTDCLFKPSEVTFTTTGGHTFIRMSSGTPTITGCYYTETLGTAQGTEAIFTTNAPSNLGSLEHDYGMVKAYERGLLFDGKYYFAPSTSTGTGTEGDPYIISDASQWDTFAANVNGGNNYSGKFLLLADDISVTTTVGLRDDKPFSGTFLGNNHTITANIVSTTTGTGANEQGVAPFHYISGATIKDLTIGGTIASASYHTGGLVGFADGTNVIENCAVTATLNVSSNYAGGFIGHGQSSATTLRGCVFAGTINGVGGNRENIGALWGWSDSGTPTLLNCLEAGNYTGIASMHPMGLQSNKGTITNCYYVNAQVGSPSNACTVSGAKQAIALATAPDGLGAQVQAYGTLTAYDNAILYDGTYYTEPATLSGEGTEAEPYLISTELDWKSFVAYVNNGNTYSGKFVRLNADIEVTDMVAGDFSGTFDGYSHTITANINGGSSAAALFRTLSGGTIKNLTVGGTVSGGIHTAALVQSLANGTDNVIENCTVTATVSGGTHIGGFLGHGNTSNIAIRGCVFSGLMTGGSTAKGIFFGWGDNGGTKSVTACLYLMADGQDTSGLDFARKSGGTVTVTGCYYTGAMVTEQATQAYAYYAAPANLGAAVENGNYGYVTAYQNGLLYGGSYYVAPSCISLADNAQNDVDAINGYAANVTLTGRTLTKNGDWNTLCLPFAMNATQIAASSLAGATIKELDAETSALAADGTLTLKFTGTTSIKAGKPYIVKWEDATGSVANPEFPGVAISSTTPTAVEFAIEGSTDKCQFVGQYSPFSIGDTSTGTFDGDLNEIIMLGSGSKLGYSQNARTLKCFRAHFLVPADPATGQALARRFVMDFGEGENTTGILEVKGVNEVNDDSWYTLDGRRIIGQPTQKGVYIVNGKKTIIK